MKFANVMTSLMSWHLQIHHEVMKKIYLQCTAKFTKTEIFSLTLVEWGHGWDFDPITQLSLLGAILLCGYSSTEQFGVPTVKSEGKYWDPDTVIYHI